MRKLNRKINTLAEKSEDILDTWFPRMGMMFFAFVFVMSILLAVSMASTHRLDNAPLYARIVLVSLCGLAALLGVFSVVAIWAIGCDDKDEETVVIEDDEFMHTADSSVKGEDLVMSLVPGEYEINGTNVKILGHGQVEGWGDSRGIQIGTLTLGYVRGHSGNWCAASMFEDEIGMKLKRLRLKHIIKIDS